MTEETRVREGALNRVRGMPFAWSLNPYRGCRHACLYCYARVYHRYAGFDDPADFDQVVLSKTDLPERLDRQLRRRRRPLEGEVAIGTATDPYQPIEARERITRRLLEVLLAHGAAVSVTTKSPLVTRDLDLLRMFGSRGGVRVNMTVTVLQATLWRLVEPAAPDPRGRLDAVRKLADAGIPTTVFLAPVIPVIGEREAQEVLAASRAAGAAYAMIQLLRLSPGVGEWLLPRIRGTFPAAARVIVSLYGGRETLGREEQRRILAPLEATRAALGLDRPPGHGAQGRGQLTLFA